MNWKVVAIPIGLALIGLSSLFVKKEETVFQSDVELPYGADNIFIRHNVNRRIVGDYDTVTIDGIRCFILPEDAPDKVNLTIVEEQHWKTYIVPVSASKLQSINGIPIKIIRTKFPVVHITSQVDDWREFDKESTEKNVPIECSIAFQQENVSFNKVHVKVTRHGNSSWGMTTKHGYNLKFDEKVSLYGMPKSKSWNLLGVGLDKTLSRDYIARVFAKNLDYPYVTEMQYVTLFVDGRYKGVYQLTEKPKKVMERVINPAHGDFAITWLDNDRDYPIMIDFKHNEFDLESAYMNGVEQWSANMEVPDADEAPYPPEYYQKKLQELVDSIEAHSTEKIDLDSWAKYYWVQEFSKNYDAWYRSAYSFYKADEDKWYQGTIWDFDRCWQYCDKKHTVDFSNYEGSIAIFGLYPDLFACDDFVKAVDDCYHEYVIDAMKTTESEVDIHKDFLGDDGYYNYQFWADDRGCITTYLDNVFSTSFEGAYNNFSDYYKNREKYIIDNHEKMLKELTNGKFSE